MGDTFHMEIEESEKEENSSSWDSFFQLLTQGKPQSRAAELRRGSRPAEWACGKLLTFKC